jgi:hypothetical protein
VREGRLKEISEDERVERCDGNVSFGDCTSSIVKLKTISLSCSHIESKKVIMVNFRVNERGSYNAGSSLINSIASTSKITNTIEA